MRLICNNFLWAGLFSRFKFEVSRSLSFCLLPYLLFTGCYPHMSCTINRQPIFPLCFFVFIAMSTEEGRLWNIVKANSLDFNVWTALIEETEKVAEVCLSKVSSHLEAVILI